MYYKGESTTFGIKHQTKKSMSVNLLANRLYKPLVKVASSWLSVAGPESKNWKVSFADWTSVQSASLFLILRFMTKSPNPSWIRAVGCLPISSLVLDNMFKACIREWLRQYPREIGCNGAYRSKYRMCQLSLRPGRLYAALNLRSAQN